MTMLTVTFTDAEKSLLRDLKIAIFRDKLIFDAQPPITDAQLAKVEQQVDGKTPPELLSLWKTCFGGELDYDYPIAFGDYIYNASFKELFYPGSQHYRTLHGWIERELELLQEVAEEQQEAVPERIPCIPFGGFEYLERFYVSLREHEYGEVIVYAQGIPWKGRLQENSVTKVAPSVAGLFDQLSLDEDPFDPLTDEYTCGKGMVERIADVEAKHPELAKKLVDVVRSNIFDWRGVVESADLKRPLSARASKALRLALEFATDRNDVGLIDQLHGKAAPFDVTLRGVEGVLGVAMAAQSFEVVSRLLNLNVPLGDAPIVFASNCPDGLLSRLVDRGFCFDEEAVFSAAETGSIQGAIAVVQSEQLAEPTNNAAIADAALKRASNHEKDARGVENGWLNSYLTAAQYLNQAKLLRDFAARLQSN